MIAPSTASMAKPGSRNGGLNREWTRIDANGKRFVARMVKFRGPERFGASLLGVLTEKSDADTRQRLSMGGRTIPPQRTPRLHWLGKSDISGAESLVGNVTPLVRLRCETEHGTLFTCSGQPKLSR
jgi:hypothetical protein